MAQELYELEHVTRGLPNGGMVLVLNTGAIITPEAEAMLQALHSRSTGGIREHLKKLAAKGPKGFMESYYVQYGHKSIGDCGTSTIFIEGVSMLVAKAIQDWLLYSGQEASTRYIDFASQRFEDPIGTAESRDILEKWREFYLASREPVRAFLKESFPMTEEDQKDEKSKGLYDKSINARSFDILRGFLPAGASTNLAWHTNLRQAADHMALLRQHPLVEVQEVADAMESALKEAFPSSFGHKRYDPTEEYNRIWMNEGYYFGGHMRDWTRSLGAPNRQLKVTRDGIDQKQLEQDYHWLLSTRPMKTELPKQVGECGTMQTEFLIDFGSFRDIQRHRSVIQRMPLLSEDFGMHPWYFEALPQVLRSEAEAFVAQQLQRVHALNESSHVLQYYFPMGMCVPCRLTGDLPALVYITERRAQTDVHPTVQEVALQLADELLKRFGHLGLTLGVDRNEGRFDRKRGGQDIVEKE